MKLSNVQALKLMSILDGTITDEELSRETIGGYSGDSRMDLWMEIMDNQSNEIIELT